MPISIYTPARREDTFLCASVVDLDVHLGERVDIWNVILSYMFIVQI